jgi:phage tail-like protein
MPVHEPVTGDPFQSFLFNVKIDGITNAYFLEVGGLGSETEVIEHKVVNAKGVEIMRKIPGRLKWGDISLKRGITSNLDFWKWFEAIETGKIDANRRDVIITMFDQSASPVAEWVASKAWVSKISGPNIKSASGEIGVEEMTLVHEGIVRKK